MGSAAEKGDEGPQVVPRDARERRHPGRRVVSRGGAHLDGDPGGIASGTDLRELGRAPVPEFAETVAVAAALPDEDLPAAARARGRCGDRGGDEQEAGISLHGTRLYAKGGNRESPA